MAKRILSGNELEGLNRALKQQLLLEIAQDSNLVSEMLLFHGGSGLCLINGSPRSSVDLDFMIADTIKTATVDDLKSRLEVNLSERLEIPPDMSVVVNKVKLNKNPASFYVSIRGENVIHSTRVKVEFWKAPRSTLEKVNASMEPLPYEKKSSIPVITLDEYFADKVFALGVRPYFASRDVFDLHWLGACRNTTSCSAEKLRHRFDVYPSQTPQSWLKQAEKRLSELPMMHNEVKSNLLDLLPEMYDLSDGTVERMLMTAERALEDGIKMVRHMDYDSSHEGHEPCP